MPSRTSFVVDAEARKAAKQLAALYDCSVSEAIRRAIVRHRDAVLGIPAATRKQRGAALARMIEAFEGNDAEAEVRRLKEEDGGF